MAAEVGLAAEPVAAEAGPTAAPVAGPGPTEALGRVAAAGGSGLAGTGAAG